MALNDFIINELALEIQRFLFKLADNSGFRLEQVNDKFIARTPEKI